MCYHNTDGRPVCFSDQQIAWTLNFELLQNLRRFYDDVEDSLEDISSIIGIDIPTLENMSLPIHVCKS